MKNKLLLTLFILTILPLFSEENKIFWDFGVTINNSKGKLNYDDKSQKDLFNTPNGKALISNSFISPIRQSRKNTIIDIVETDFNQISNYNINQIKLLIKKLTLKKLYQPVIEIINFVDLNNSELQELNYWLANALLNTGKYEMAENIIINSFENEFDDKSNFLLATIYEHQNKTKKAQKEYLNLINNFPNSDYKMVASIKARMLDQE
ncbi:MAG: hypothetical protein VX820_05710 [Candidatus Neomarinimicrobiota bacterium]|nr:hypothetical protein [Candidatus Neomarinimicrobiota bacterium]